MLLDQVLQPSIISLFSSTSSHPLLLATDTRTSSTNSDSFISLVDDTAPGRTEGELISFNAGPSELTKRPQAIQEANVSQQKNLKSRVLHLQDPDCRTTSVKWGNLEKKDGKGSEEALGIQLEYLHLQVKNLGQNFYFDVAVIDERGDIFVIRSSNFQSDPKIYPPNDTKPTLLSLPLTFPPLSPTLLTSWSTITLPLAALLSSIPQLGAPAPGRFARVIGVEVHANIRVRRIWFSNDGKEPTEEMVKKGIMSELALYVEGDGE